MSRRAATALFIAEGSSDAALADLVSELFLDQGISLRVTAPDFARLGHHVGRAPKNTVGAAASLFDGLPDVIIVHRDGDRVPSRAGMPQPRGCGGGVVLTLTDLFCGAGGSSTGAVEVPGVVVRMAANHWDLAVQTHNINHPGTDHACADISQVDPRYFPRTDLLWASPECTHHSGARGTRRVTDQLDLFAPLPDEAAQRSRATMWDVVRFTEHHRYRAVVVENIIETYHWPPFRSWLMAMQSLGYDHQVVWLNSMHAQAAGLPAPQSRDRMYVVFHRSGDRRPDVGRWQRPQAWCTDCGSVVSAVQSWKNPAKQAGRYRAQYFYRCPNSRCRHKVVEPGWLPAATVIDWSLPGQRIGERTRPLAAKTRARIAAGIARYWAQPLAVPVEARDGKTAAILDAALRTQTTRLETALVVPAGGTWNTTAAPVSAPVRTRTARDPDAVDMPPFMAELRGGGSTHCPVTEPLCTVTAGGNHHALIAPYYGCAVPRPAGQALPTVTTVERHALLTHSTGDDRNHVPLPPAGAARPVPA